MMEISKGQMTTAEFYKELWRSIQKEFDLTEDQLQAIKNINYKHPGYAINLRNYWQEIRETKQSASGKKKVK